MTWDRIAWLPLIRPAVAGHLPPRGKGTPLAHREREAADRQGEGSLAQPYFITL
jgi:hypothetical protein